MQPSRLLTVSFLLAAAWASSCASETTNLRSAGTASPTPTGNRDPNVDNPSIGGSSSGGAAAQKLNPLCGNPGQCNPDSITDCRDFTPASPSGGAPGAGVGGVSNAGEAGGTIATTGFGGNSGGQAGNANAAGSSGAGVSAGAAGLSGAAGALGGGPLMSGGANAVSTGGAGGTNGVGTNGVGGAAQLLPPTFEAPPNPPVYACRVERGPANQALAECALAGAGKLDDPCNSSADCSPGLGCVGDSALARCRPFCCENGDTCAAGSYCSNEPLREPSPEVTPPLLVPVCVAADNCDLGEPFPCALGRTCTCSSATACSVVRSDGTTSCVAPGKGLVGQACPCSAGHICSQGSGLCLKLCRTTDANATCNGGRCQIAAGLPTGYGVCVGVPASNGGAGGELGAANP